MGLGVVSHNVWICIRDTRPDSRLRVRLLWVTPWTRIECNVKVVVDMPLSAYNVKCANINGIKRRLARVDKVVHPCRVKSIRLSVCAVMWLLGELSLIDQQWQHQLWSIWQVQAYDIGKILFLYVYRKNELCAYFVRENICTNVSEYLGSRVFTQDYFLIKAKMWDDHSVIFYKYT